MARMPTLLQRIDTLKDNGNASPEQHKILRALARSARAGIYGLVAELDVTIGDLLGVEGDFIKCRSLRHWWDDAEFIWEYRPMGMPEVMCCARCGMYRIHVYGLNNKPNGKPRYVQPNGYAFKGAGRRLTSADFNLVRLYLKVFNMVEAIEADPAILKLESLMSSKVSDLIAA